MKMSKIGLVSLAILGLAFLAPVPVRASSAANWLNVLNSTGDPLGLSNAYTTGSNLNLQIVLQNPYNFKISIISAQIGMDWGTNYTNTAITNAVPLQIPAFGQAVIAFSGSGTSPAFTAPSTTPGSSPFASNLVNHSPIFAWTFFNVTQTATSTTPPFACFGVGSQRQCPLGNFVFIPSMAVYSSDQAGAIAALEQVYPIVTSGGLFSAFNTTQARYDALQAYVYYTQATQAYQTFNFNTSKTDWQSSYTWWKQAVTAQNNTETSKTSTINSNNTSALNNGALGGYGTILLGVGIVLAGAGVLVYGIRRPKASMAPH